MEQSIYKVGYTSQTIKGLMKRYHTAYGGDIILLMLVPGSRNDETAIFKYLEKFRMNGSELVQLDLRTLKSVILRHFYMTGEITDITDKLSGTSLTPVKSSTPTKAVQETKLLTPSSPTVSSPSKNRTTVPPPGTQFGSFISTLSSYLPAIRKTEVTELSLSSIFTTEVIGKFNNTRTTQGARSEFEFNKAELYQLAVSIGISLPRDDTVRNIKVAIKSHVDRSNHELASQLRIDK